MHQAAVCIQHKSRHDMSLSGHLKAPSAVNSCLRLQVQSVSEDELLDATSAAGDLATIPADICVVDTVEEARRVVNLLRNTYRNGDWFFACDTEVSLDQNQHICPSRLSCSLYLHDCGRICKNCDCN